MKVVGLSEGNLRGLYMLKEIRLRWNTTPCVHKVVWQKHRERRTLAMAFRPVCLFFYLIRFIGIKPENLRGLGEQRF